MFLRNLPFCSSAIALKDFRQCDRALLEAMLPPIAENKAMGTQRFDPAIAKFSKVSPNNF
ncbi:MAG: hypothetical protein J7647_20550 [Cyanobacteria bacterium SBLK]|nr:hypothetical protein [Cyanobacteria bacterium SBLK]